MFKYPDTNSSRANIEYLNRKFEGYKVAIIGLGGTGSYILDFLSKTPVEEIHLFDGDIFQLHNAFRAPGAISIERMESEEEIFKVHYFEEIYSQMHDGIKAHPVFVTEENVSLLSHMHFVFISVDKNMVRSFLAEMLLSFKVPFIDVGMGINRVDDSLIGSMRMTYGSADKNDHLKHRFGQMDFDESEYSTNIQIAELNCQNAIMAITKWKKVLGFYQDLKEEHNTLYFLNTNKVLNEDHKA